MTAPHTPPAAPDLAAIEARAAAATYAASVLLAAFRSSTSAAMASSECREALASTAVSAADVPALLAHITALRAQHAADVAAARAEALREAEDACRDVGDDYDPRCRERVGAHACAAAVAALGTKGGGA